RGLKDFGGGVELLGEQGAGGREGDQVAAVVDEGREENQPLIGRGRRKARLRDEEKLRARRRRTGDVVAENFAAVIEIPGAVVDDGEVELRTESHVSPRAVDARKIVEIAQFPLPDVLRRDLCEGVRIDVVDEHVTNPLTGLDRTNAASRFEDEQ